MGKKAHLEQERGWRERAQTRWAESRAGGPGATTTVVPPEVGDGPWEGRHHLLEDADGD